MAEHQILGSSSYFIHLFFLGVICLSTCCSGESHVAYDVASPSKSFVVSDIVSHPRLRRDTNNVTQPSDGSTVNSTGIATSTPAPSDGGNSSSDSSNNSTNNPEAQNGTSTAAPSTSDPFEGVPIIEDSKDYYVVKSNIRNFDKYWTELSQTSTRHEKLSKSHRVAAVIRLGFKFPFYGHLVDNVTIATGGFIYMSPFLHQWLTATQYIAPLMANFDLSISSESNIYYMNLEDSFTVEWRNVILKDQNNTGPFTFQAMLNATGEITFVYKDVPLAVNDISNTKHPVKIGVSDAYYNDTYFPRLNIRKRTIYEYHRVSVDMERVKSKSVVILQPLPTCNTLTDCTTCTEHKGVSFNCQWCNTIGRCSDGLDWYRQHWDRYGCQRTKTANPAVCQRYTRRPPVVSSTRMISTSTSTTTTVSASSLHSESTSTPEERKTTQMNSSLSTNASSWSTTETSAASHKTTPTSTTPMKITATLPTTTSTVKPSPSQSTTRTETSSVSTSTTTSNPSQSTNSMTKKSSQSTINTTKKSSESTTSTAKKSSESTTSTTKKSSDSTTSTTKKSSLPTTSNTNKSSQSTTSATKKSSQSTTSATKKSSQSTTSATKKSSDPTAQSGKRSTQSSTPATSLDNGGVALPSSGRGYGFCSNGKCGKGSSTPVAVIVIVILLIAALAAGLGGWVFYAYTHPTSRSGMWLMEHRPSQMKAKIQFWKSSSDSGAAKYKMESDA